MKMAELRDACAAAGLENVRTHLQSGNVIFARGGSRSAAETTIEKAVESRFGFHADAAVRTAKELADIVAGNPLSATDAPNPSWLVAMFAKATPDADAITRFARGYAGPERVRVRDGVVYIYHADGIARSKLPAAMAKAKLAIDGTARNITVVTALAELAKT